MKKAIFIILLSIFLSFFYFNKIYALEPAVIEIRQENFTEKTINLNLNFNIKDGWHIYSNIESDIGVPLKIKFKDLNQNKIVNNYTIKWPESKEKKELIGDEEIISYVFEKQVSIPVEIYSKKKIYDNTPFQINIEYAACGNICTFHKKNIKFIAKKDNLPKLNSESIKHFLLIILFGFIGGFIINLMPCVIPVVSLKIFHLLDYKRGEKKKFKYNLFFTTLGIILSFICLASVTSILKVTGSAIGWGFHFQEPVFIMVLAIIMVIVSSNLWGNFEFHLPHYVSTKLSNIGIGKGYLANFLSGIIITLLATPCTAPFLTTAVSYALSQSIIHIFVIYFFIGLGMSTPYICLMFNTNLLNFIPKPGMWMFYLKKTFAILIILNVVWLLWILKNQLSFKAALIFAGVIIVSKAVLIYLYRHHYKLLLTILFPTFIVFSIGFTNYFFQNELKEQQEINSYWKKFSLKTLEEAIKNDQIILVDISADWCITCKVNKVLVLDTKHSLKFLEENNVLLLYGDYTLQEKQIRDFLLSHNKHGIPFNIVYGPKNKNGIILSSLLTNKELREAIQKVQ